MEIQLRQLPNPEPVDWKGLHQTRKEIKSFLKSLTPEQVKMAFNKELFVLEPRAWIKQEGGRFTAIEEGFILLSQKVNTLVTTIESFNPNQCPREELTFLYDLEDIETIINSKARSGLTSLCATYTQQRDKEGKANSLKKMGEGIFQKFGCATKLLRERVIPYYRQELATVSELQKLRVPIAKYMRRNIENLRLLQEVTWYEHEGVCIPSKLIKEWFLDARLPTQDPEIATANAFLNAANHMQVSQYALPLPVQNLTSWIPLRLTKPKSEIVLDEANKGVTGTYERGLGAKDLCNVYFRQSDGCISTSAIDTPLKAAEISVVIKHVLDSITHENGRWILHQLNSFFSETDLIHNVHNQIPSIEKELKFKQPNIAFLHVNTPFNAATNFPYENDKSVTNINIDSLAQLAQFAMDDVDLLLEIKDKLMLEWRQGRESIEAVLKIALKIKEVKKKRVEEDSQLNEDINATVQDQALSTYQEELKTALCTFSDDLKALRSALIAVKDPDGRAVEKIYLILEVLQTILSLQLNLEGKPALSRCSEVELFLLLYRLLNIKRVISCYSGLDRTNTVVAMDDSLERVFECLREFHSHSLVNTKRINSQLIGNKIKGDELNFVAETRAYRNLFELIVNIDTNRTRLIELGNESLKDVPVNHVISSIEKKKIDDLEGRVNLRHKVLQKIVDEESLMFVRRNQTDDPNLLKYTLFYLELMTKHLITTQIKTFASTGLLGYCWHWERNWAVVNPHPKERLVQFINAVGEEQDQKATVQLTYPYSYVFDSVTPAAIQIFCRLSSLRGD